MSRCKRLTDNEKLLVFHLKDLVEQIDQFHIRSGINMAYAKEAIEKVEGRKG